MQYCNPSIHLNHMTPSDPPPVHQTTPSNPPCQSMTLHLGRSFQTVFWSVCSADVGRGSYSNGTPPWGDQAAFVTEDQRRVGEPGAVPTKQQRDA